MFKKKDVKKFDDMSENNNSSSSERLNKDELLNVAGGRYRDLTIEDKDRLTELYNKKINNGSLTVSELFYIHYLKNNILIITSN